MSGIPTHKVIQQSDFGIFLKEISPSHPKEPIRYVHRDDYYVFGIINGGNCCVSLDFKDYRLSENDIICTQPGQIHHVTNTSDLKAFFLFVDSVFIGSSDKQIIAEYALHPVPLRPDDKRLSELNQIFRILAHRTANPENEDSKRIIQHLACAVIGMITETIRNTISSVPRNRRHTEIVLAFRELLSNQLHINRSPSRYADQLHISPVYLNEVVKNITGISVSRYIQNELVLRAKQMLIYTPQNIQEVALSLGVNDYTYFTRLFTKITGISPTAYRKKYLG